MFLPIGGFLASKIYKRILNDRPGSALRAECKSSGGQP